MTIEHNAKFHSPPFFLCQVKGEGVKFFSFSVCQFILISIYRSKTGLGDYWFARFRQSVSHPFVSGPYLLKKGRRNSL